MTETGVLQLESLHVHHGRSGLALADGMNARELLLQLADGLMIGAAKQQLVVVTTGETLAAL